MNYLIRFIVCIFSILLMIGLCSSCIRYERMTHLSDEEQEWITNRYVGEKMYFQSQTGIADTITIREIKIQNTTDSIDWNYYTTGGSGVYYAGGHVYFSLRDIPYFNSFYLYKDTDELVYFGAEILYVWMSAEHLVDTCVEIGGSVFDDIVYIDEKNCEVINKDNLANPISALAWSKKYGLVQYIFQDGTVFNRIDLKQKEQR